MKVTVFGTRPEIIRLSRMIQKLDGLCSQQMGIRSPSHHLGVRRSVGEQVGMILTQIEPLLREEKPDRFLVLGDTNSALAAIVAKRMHTPVYHLVAGNRCYDDRVPEERTGGLAAPRQNIWSSA